MKILFIDIVHPFLKKELEKKNHICDIAYNKTRDEILSIILDYEGIVLRSRIKIDYDFLNKCQGLKFIARAGSGLENIDVIEAEKRNIKCFNAPRTPNTINFTGAIMMDMMKQMQLKQIIF